jgi:hypothetical protein
MSLKQTFSILLIALLGIAFQPLFGNDFKAKADNYYSWDESGYSINTVTGKLTWEKNYQGLSSDIKTSLFAATPTEPGVYDFEGQFYSMDFGMFGLFNLWWVQLKAGLWSSNNNPISSGNIIVAHVSPLKNSKLTLSIEGAKTPIAYSALGLSLEQEKYFATIRSKLESSLILWQSAITYDYYPSLNTSQRTQNADLQSIPKNNSISISSYIIKNKNWDRLGLSGAYTQSEQNYNQAVSISPNYYTWYPLHTPISAWNINALFHFHFTKENGFNQKLGIISKIDIPLASFEKRQFESIQKEYYGTAPCKANIEAQYAIGQNGLNENRNYVFSSFETSYTPWDNYQFFDNNSYKSYALKIGLII